MSFKAKSKQLNLTDDQKSHLREKEQSEVGSVESAFLKLYTEVWLPKLNGAGLGVESVAVGGRQLVTRLDDQKKARVHDRVIELLRDLHRRVFSSVLPSKIVGLFQLGEGDPLKLGIKTSEVVDGFYSFLGFTRLDSNAAIRKAVARGVKEGVFGYSAGTIPTLGIEGKYQLPAARVRLGSEVAEDEVDLETGFLMMPQALPGEATAATTGPGLPLPSTGGAPPPTVPGQSGAQGGPVTAGLPGVTPTLPLGAIQKVVEINFAADRDQLYSAWPPLANLADMAGKVSVTVRAESENGFDRTKLQNGVLEPLKEADLIE